MKMKYLLLSADSIPSVYLVPEIVADNLDKYCNEFWDWMRTSPQADEYRVDLGGYSGLSYTEEDFIKYLNMWVFPDAPCRLVERLDGIWKRDDIPKKYEHCKWFNF